jgi:hypothetical protein
MGPERHFLRKTFKKIKYSRFAHQQVGYFFSDAYGNPLSVYVSGDKQRHLAVAVDFKQK